MTVRRFLLLTLLIAVFSGVPSFAATKPNIVYILCDDLGYGDVSALNPDHGKIKTPHIDQLAAAGMVFTDAHSSSSVCTPTRYDLLTGRYNWRSRLQKGVLQGDSPPLIALDRMTVATLLRDAGYTTAAIGKWHLGMTMDPQNWSAGIKDGPLQHGFDSYFGIAASLDMPPFAFIEGDHFTELPTATKKWVRSGPAAPSFEAVDVLPTLTRKSVEFIAKQKDAKSPFFLYLAFTSPHTPIVPSKEWQGKSGLGPYGDFVMQTDAAVGDVLSALHDAGLDDSTLVVFTSDNGCSPAAKPAELEAKGHFPSADFRGYKSDIWDGGHRIPFIVRWPGKVKSETRSNHTICLGGFVATGAAMLDVKLPDNAGEDSVSILSALTNSHYSRPLREAIVHHSIDGRFAIRQGNWKLCLCAGSGGWSAPREAAARKQKLPAAQLYDLSTDIAEKNNVAADHPDVVAKLTALLDRYIAEGRSTPGTPQKNDVEIDLDKPPAATQQAE